MLMSMYIKLEFPDFYKETPLFLGESGGAVGYPSRVSRAGPGSSTLSLDRRAKPKERGKPAL